MALLQRFNAVYVETFRIIGKCFPDGDRKEEKALHQYITELEKLIVTNSSSTELLDMVKQEMTKEHEDAVYNIDEKDEGDVFLKNEIPFLARIHFDVIWRRFIPPERKLFIRNFTSICQNYHLMLTCGDSIKYIEDAARRNAPKPGEEVDPEELNTRVIEDLFSSKQFISDLTKKGAIQNIIGNVGGIVRNAKGETSNDLFDIANIAQTYANMGTYTDNASAADISSMVGMFTDRKSVKIESIDE